MLHARRLLILVLGLLLAGGCGAEPQARPVPPAPSAALPTVTPVGPTPSAARPQVLRLPTAAPTATATPTATAELSAAGVRTASMVQLGLAAESYNALGDPAAPVTVIEFSDYGCTFCRRHHLLNWPELKRRYVDTGLVLYVFKDLPVTSRQGGRAAAAVGCAAEQGLADGLRSVLFAAPERWDVVDAQVDDALAALIVEVNGDAAALRACLADGRYQAEVEADLQEAERLRLFGTPYFFINGRLLAGSQPLEQWLALLDAEIAGGDVQ